MPAFYIVLQEEIPGVDAIGLEGRALSKHSQELEALAKQTGVTPLMSFFSADPSELTGLLEEAEGIDVPPLAWFEAEDGLKTIAALLRALESSQSSESSVLTGELAMFQRVLEAARSKNIRWHLAIDI